MSQNLLSTKLLSSLNPSKTIQNSESIVSVMAGHEDGANSAGNFSSTVDYGITIPITT